MPRRPSRKAVQFAVLSGAALLAACAVEVRGTGAPTDDRDALGEQPAAAEVSDAAAAGPLGDTDAGSDAAEASTPDSAIFTGDPCDQDGDGKRAKSSRCGGDDCCDTDPRVYDGSTSFYPTRSACGTFDYDCSGREEPEVDLVADCHADFFDCVGDGFEAKTACGSVAPYVVCAFKGLSCNGTSSPRTQGCR